MLAEKKSPHNVRARCEQARGSVELTRRKNKLARQLLKKRLEVERDGGTFRQLNGRHFSILDGDGALFPVDGRSRRYFKLHFLSHVPLLEGLIPTAESPQPFERTNHLKHKFQASKVARRSSEQL